MNSTGEPTNDELEIEVVARGTEHYTHLLDATGCLVEHAAVSVAELIGLLDAQGFAESDHPPLTKRSVIRTTRAADVRLLTREMNAAHDQYVVGNLDLELYVAKIFEFLEDSGPEEHVSQFLADNAEKIEQKTFCPKSKTFAPFLKAAWNAYSNDNALEPVARAC